MNFKMNDKNKAPFKVEDVNWTNFQESVSSRMNSNRPVSLRHCSEARRRVSYR